MSSTFEKLRNGEREFPANNSNPIVVAGISGAFPSSDNVKEYLDNLQNKIDMVTFDYSIKHAAIPKNHGKIPNVQNFDSGYFGMHPNRATYSDPSVRVILKKGHEAIMDAGIHPDELIGSRTGVFLGSSISEYELMYYETLKKDCPIILGCTKSMQAQSLSYSLQLNGPAYNCDTACSSGTYAFEEAYRAIVEGRCDRALVCSCNLCLEPLSTLAFARLGVLNYGTGCNPFDEEAHGYTRSEAIVVILLQRESEARRVYARVVHSKCNADGFKENGITFPSSESQLALLTDVIRESKVNINEIGFMEAHGTGTKVGDPAELNALDTFFKPTVDKPLLIGSVKGNIGHTEPSSGLCSIVKTTCILNFNNILPNIHYNKPRDTLDALIAKRVKVVTENMPFPKGHKYAGVNSFGFGGGNCHVLFEQFNKKKSNDSGLPRLVCFSGRTREAIETIQKSLENTTDHELCALLHEAYKMPYNRHLYRGFSIVPSKKSDFPAKLYDFTPRKLALLIGDFRMYPSHLMFDLLKLPPFSKTLKRIELATKSKGINVSIENSTKSDIPQESLIALIIQLGLANMIMDLDLNLDLIVSKRLGYLTAAYMRKELTFVEVVLCACSIISCQDQKPATLLNNLTKVISNTQASEVMRSIYARDDALRSQIENVKNCTILGIDCDQTHLKNIKLGKRSYLLEVLSPKMELADLLENIGRLYVEGFQPQIQFLYPVVEFPVGRGTDFLSPMIQWKDKTLMELKHSVAEPRDLERTVFINVSDAEFNFYRGHIIDDRVLFPATGYLWLIWNFYCDATYSAHESMQVWFENVKFHRACNIGSDEKVQLRLCIARGGAFEISELGTTLVSGKFFAKDAEGTEVFGYKEPDFNKQSFVMSAKDIYKELRLRGYNYKGLFRGIHQIGSDAAQIKWEKNWVTFLDNMLQTSILQLDSKSLYVPVHIDYIYINAQQHMEQMEQLEEHLVPLHYDPMSNSVLSKFIEIRGMQSSSIAKRKLKLLPVLEISKFIPNECQINLLHAVRVNIQIILECTPTAINFKMSEISKNDNEFLSPLIRDILADVPLVLPELFLITDKHVQVENVTVQNELPDDNTLVVLHTDDNRTIERGLKSLASTGFLIYIGKNPPIFNKDLNILTKNTIIENDKCMYMIRKKLPASKSSTIVNISDVETMKWLSELQKAMAQFDEVIVLAENANHNGILGMVNCLRREPGGDKARCVFLMDNIKFDMNSKLFKDQLEKRLPINILKDGKWGTYRHLPLTNTEQISCEHYFAKATNAGDLSTLQWLKGPIETEMYKGKYSKVIYSALNFRDLMLASGKLSPDAITKNRFKQDMLQGLEFSGYDSSGQPIAAICDGAISNYVLSDLINLKIPLPEGWSIEDGATCLVVYATCIYALEMRAEIKKGQSVLIHSGTGGIGLAALNICSHYNCEIFVTVGTQEKREFLLNNYPNLKAQNIGNSRDCSFREMIHRETKGRGVDIVLNSLAEEKLRASVDCLAPGGYFLEIGKYDLDKNNDFYLDITQKQCTYEGIMLDKFVSGGSNETTNILLKYFDRALKNKYIKPLPRTVFKKSELEKAFKYMSTGKHIGKILIKIDDDEEIKATPVVHCSPLLSYIVFGGLGGFGLELVDWLILRGAKNIVISSRTGIREGYQKYRVNLWKSYGLNIVIFTEDVLTIKGCTNIINEANKLAPVGGIYNLAVVLKDAIFEHQTVETMRISYGPKSLLTQHLDKLSRQMCPKLRQFVIFSSVSCGRGNAGQTNYGFSNSVMERICESRRKDGLPGLAIQWGAVGDVGLLEELQKDNTEIAIGGTLQQKIANCLEVMDKLMHQDEAIVSSVVVAEKFGRASADSPVDVVIRILGITDVKSVGMHSRLPELGMDSMMAVEIKQALEREFDILLTANEIRSLTFAKLEELNSDHIDLLNTKPNDNDIVMNLGYILPVVSFEKTNDTIINLNPHGDQLVIGFPGIEGNAFCFAKLAALADKSVRCPYYNNISSDNGNIEQISHFVYKQFIGEIKKQKSFIILSHSYGCLPALDFVRHLEKEGITGTLVFIDSAPLLLQTLLRMFLEDNEVDFECQLLEFIMAKMLPSEDFKGFRTQLQNQKDFNQRMKFIIDKYAHVFGDLVDDLGALVKPMYSRLKSIRHYSKKGQDYQIKSRFFLYKPSEGAVITIADDYGLSEFCTDTNKVIVRQFEGDHQSILENEELIATFVKDLFN